MYLPRYEVKIHENDIHSIFDTDNYEDAIVFRDTNGGIIMRNRIDYQGNEWQEVVDE